MSRHPTPRQVNAALDFYEKLAEPLAPSLDLVEAGGCAPPVITGPTFTEEYRHQCEVRHVRAMGSARQQEYLKGVAEKRGAPAAERIKGDL
ncbi:MAG TPA: hypothetical protein VJ797_15630 [Burkholderiales bacterium]|nr:hypothetical protein [Burkholderiales bacterium]